MYIFTVLALIINTPVARGAVKDQSRLGDDVKPVKPPASNPYLPDTEFPDEPFENPEETDKPSGSEFDINSIPTIETIELTMQTAKKALDAYELVGEKYNDLGLDQYDTLEEFVKNTKAGKKLENEVKAFGFSDITNWNSTIMAVSFAWSTILYDQDDDIRSQIESVKDDKSIKAREKLKIISSLNALIPSKNNKDIITTLSRDKTYMPKLRLLEDFE